MHFLKSRWMASLALAIFSSACVSTTIIRSQPPGARLFLDGSPVGATPYPMSDTKIWGSATTVRLEAPGYEPLTTVITRSEEFDPAACAGGFFLLFPWLWLMGYRADHYYELVPGGGMQGYPPPGYPQPGYPPQQYPPQQYPPQQYPPQQYPPQQYPPQQYPPQQQYPQGQPPPPPPPPSHY